MQGIPVAMRQELECFRQKDLRAKAQARKPQGRIRRALKRD
jgi:hypothetical protein